MADPEKDPKDEEQQNNSSEEQGNENPPDPKVEAKQEDSGDDTNDPYSGFSTRELRRVIDDLTASSKSTAAERDSLKKTVEEAERKQRTKEENLEKDVAARDSTIETLRAANQRLAILGAIRDETKYNWHNPEIVAQQLNWDVVKVDDDGKVEGLQTELARIAKDHEYLLKKDAPKHKGPTGIQPGQGAPGGKTTVADLAKHYPALASRV